MSIITLFFFNTLDSVHLIHCHLEERRLIKMYYLRHLNDLCDLHKSLQRTVIKISDILTEDGRLMSNNPITYTYISYRRVWRLRSDEDRFRAETNDMQIWKAAAFKWPKKEKAKPNRRPKEGRGCHRGGGRGREERRGKKRDNSERMKCKSRNGGNVAEN